MGWMTHGSVVITVRLTETNHTSRNVVIVHTTGVHTYFVLGVTAFAVNPPHTHTASNKHIHRHTPDPAGTQSVWRLCDSSGGGWVAVMAVAVVAVVVWLTRQTKQQ